MPGRRVVLSTLRQPGFPKPYTYSNAEIEWSSKIRQAGRLDPFQINRQWSWEDILRIKKSEISLPRKHWGLLPKKPINSWPEQPGSCPFQLASIKHSGPGEDRRVAIGNEPEAEEGNGWIKRGEQGGFDPGSDNCAEEGVDWDGPEKIDRILAGQAAHYESEGQRQRRLPVDKLLRGVEVIVMSNENINKISM